MTITDRNVRDQVDRAADKVNTRAVADAIIARWGLVDIDEVPGDEFWALVDRHDHGA